MILNGNTRVNVYLTETTVEYGEWEEVDFQTVLREYAWSNRRYTYSIEFTDLSKWFLERPRMPEKFFRKRVYYTGEERRSEILPVDVEFERVSSVLGTISFKYAAVFKQVVGTIDGVCVADDEGHVLVTSPLTPTTLEEGSEYMIHGSIDVRVGRQ